MITRFSTPYVGHIDLERCGLAGTPADGRRYPNERLIEVFDTAAALARTADSLGYETLWLSEHHFQHEGYECIPNIRSSHASPARSCRPSAASASVRPGAFTNSRVRGLKGRVQEGTEMASIHREMLVEAEASAVWDAIRDVGAIHTRLAPGFVVDTRLEEGARVVTFGNGLVARELIVDVDHEGRRLVWSVVGGRPSHHNASLQVFPDGARRCRVVWIADLLPNELAGAIAGMIDQGMAVMKKTLESPLSAG